MGRTHPRPQASDGYRRLLTTATEGCTSPASVRNRVCLTGRSCGTGFLRNKCGTAATQIRFIRKIPVSSVLPLWLNGIVMDAKEWPKGLGAPIVVALLLLLLACGGCTSPQAIAKQVLEA